MSKAYDFYSVDYGFYHRAIIRFFSQTPHIGFSLAFFYSINHNLYSIHKKKCLVILCLFYNSSILINYDFLYFIDNFWQ